MWIKKLQQEVYREKEFIWPPCSLSYNNHVLYTHMHMYNHNDNTIKKMSETVQNCNILTTTLLAITMFLSNSPGLLNRGPGGPASLGAGFLYRILSPTHLVPNSQSGAWGLPLLGAGFLYRIVSNWSDLQTDWISCALSYIIVQRPPSSCGHHNFALIQPVHSQGYNILIDRMHLLFTQVHFLFWQPSRVVGQYTTRGYTSTSG